ncbi:MAG: hypothetical protein M0Z85_03315 [Gammaproteobacteria bacterium]|nr:hypothetical protein [Gammaproteobacteria bacterium]
MNLKESTTATEQVSAFQRLGVSASDALTDEMVGRLAEMASSGITLLDEFNRAGLTKVLPMLSRMVESGDLERVAHAVRLVGAAEDALTEDMIGRLTEMLGGAMTLLDKAHRAGLGRALTLADQAMSSLRPSTVDRLVERVPQFIRLLSHMEEQQLLEDVVDSVEKAVLEAGQLPRPKGGVGGLWTWVKKGEIQGALRFYVLFSRHFQAIRAGRGDR